MSATNLNIRTDKEIKNQAEEIFNELGLNMTTAINMFLKTVVREYGIPFELKLDVPQETAAESALESKKMLSTFQNVNPRMRKQLKDKSEKRIG